MTYDRKLIRNGNSWALCLNSTILKFLDVNPEKNMVKYSIFGNKLLITKSEKNVVLKENSKKHKK